MFTQRLSALMHDLAGLLIHQSLEVLIILAIDDSLFVHPPPTRSGLFSAGNYFFEWLSHFGMSGFEF